MTLFSKRARVDNNVSPIGKIEMYRQDGMLVITVGAGRRYRLSREDISQVDGGRETKLMSSLLSRMARVLEMSEETLLACLGLSPRNYLQRAFGLTVDQAESVIETIWELRRLEASSENEKGKAA